MTQGLSSYPSCRVNQTTKQATTLGEGQLNIVRGEAWKRKTEGKLSRFLNQLNKRNLTIDFTQEQFFYSKPAGTQDTVGLSQSFDDLKSVYAISSPEAGKSLLGMFGLAEADKEAWTNTTARVDLGQHGICVQTRQRDFEFYFMTSADA